MKGGGGRRLKKERREVSESNHGGRRRRVLPAARRNDEHAVEEEGESGFERGRRQIRSMMMMKVRGCGFGIWKGKKEVFGVWKYIRVLGHFTQLSFFPYLFTSPIFNFLSQNKL